MGHLYKFWTVERESAHDSWMQLVVDIGGVAASVPAIKLEQQLQFTTLGSGS